MTTQIIYLKAKTEELVFVPDGLGLFENPDYMALKMAEAIIEPLGIINF